MSRRSVFAVAVIVASVSGCSSESAVPIAADPSAPVAPASQTPPPPAAPADGGSYTSAQAIMDFLSQYGHTCQQGDNPALSEFDGATDVAQCASPGSASQDTQIIIFKTHAAAASYASTAVVALDGLPADTSAVIGIDWVLETKSSEFASIAQSDLGGQLLKPQDAPSQTPAATPAPEQVTYACTGHAPGGVQITYGPNGSQHSASSLPFTHTEPLTQGAQYYVTTAQLQGGGSVSCTTTVQVDDLNGYADPTSNTGSADGGYNIASAQVCSDATSGWTRC